MLRQLPKRALLCFEIPIHRIARPPAIDGDISKWDAKHLAPPLVQLDDDEPIADVYWAWNEAGFYAAFDVPERTGPLRCNADHWWKHDGVRLCLDTRDARDNKRATRYCHFFYALPTGGGARRDKPIVGHHRMSRAKEPPGNIDIALIQVASKTTRRGYSLELGIPAACLTGWDPAEHPRIGIFYKVKDTSAGSQHLTVTDDLGWNVDPSTWATALLTG